MYEININYITIINKNNYYYEIMPKCPFCGSSQSNGTKLQEHLYTKHRDQEHSFERTTSSIIGKRNIKSKNLIVVDGNNVAYAQGNPPEAKFIKIARNSLKKSNYSPIIIISSALRHKVSDKLELIKMINLGWVIEAESFTDDDRLIIDTAFSKNCRIISNDRYLDHLEDYISSSVDLRSKLIKFRISGNRLVLNSNLMDY